jgi:two-component system sensor histidine kinase QseC
VRPLRRSSLRARLLGRVLAGVTMLWMLAAVLAWVDTRRELDSLLDGHLAQSAALLIALQLEDGGEAALPPASNLHRYSPRVAFQVWRDGVLEMHSWNAPAEPLAPLVPGFHATHLSGRDWRVYAARPRQASDAIVLIGELGYSREEILEAVLRSSLLPLLVALPLLGLSVWWAVRLGLVPLDRLGRELATRDPAELTPVRIDDAPIELLPLIHALNELFDRTHALLSSERRFTADAAHELRTPIAGIRAQAQAALAVADPAARRHALQATLAGCDRATRLVQQLLTLARLEAEPQCRQGRADLVALARDEVVEIASTAFEEGQDLQFEAPEEAGWLQVQGEPTLLAVLLRNLIDNALRYSPAGATVRVSVLPPAELAVSGEPGEPGETPPPRARLIVEDSGPGLSPEHLQRLGERFFRALGNDRPGSGLGWSIVRRIAMALQLDVQVDRSPDLGGLRVSVSVAMAPQEPPVPVPGADQPSTPPGPPPEPERSRT